MCVGMCHSRAGGNLAITLQLLIPLFCTLILFANTSWTQAAQVPDATAAHIQRNVQKLLSCFEGEPSIQQVHEQVIAYTKTNPQQVQSWQARARTAAWVPKLQTSVGQDLDRGSSVREEVGDADIFYTKDSRGLTWDVKANWQLDRLVFNTDELAVSKQAGSLWQLQQKALQQVTKAYFARRQLQVQHRLDPPKSVGQLAQERLQIEQLESEIDQLTGGWFSQQLKQTGRQAQ